MYIATFAKRSYYGVTSSKRKK